MANTTGSDKQQITPWDAHLLHRLPAAPPATSTIFYAAQACGRDVNGNMIQCDDTQRLEFLGFLVDIIRVQVDPVDVVQNNGISGDKEFDVVKPSRFTAYITAAAPGDEGKKVYWKFNNQVSYGPADSLVNYNYAGTVEKVINATTIIVTPPWIDRALGAGAVRSNQALSGSAGTTLTKWDVNRTFQVPAAAALTVTLPPVAKCSPGDRITFVNTGTGAQQVTLSGNGANINGAATSTALGTAQYSKLTVETDGTQWLIVA